MCGIFGVYSSKKGPILEDVYLGLYALQHRGQEAAGISWIDDEGLARSFKGSGLVHTAIDQSKLTYVNANAAIGHVRYPTAGGSGLSNTQPLTANSSRGAFAVAHNGNITNYQPLKVMLENRGAIFQSSADTEILLHLISHQPHKPFLDALIDSACKLTGAFSLAFLREGQLIAMRDPWGFRPLILGKRGDIWYVASESCALDLVGAERVREIEPGEILIIDDDGLKSMRIPYAPKKQYFCAFEYVYFARPDSVINGLSVYETRRKMGQILARNHPCPNADLVMGMPDSGTIAALGYGKESGTEYESAIVRNRYSGRTFIEPTQRVRELGVLKKLNPIKELIDGKEIVVVDDSIVRGTTSKKVVDLLKNKCGALGVNMAISSPPVSYPCYYGIDTPNREELVAARMTSIQQLSSELGASSISYLTVEELTEAIGMDPSQLCMACFNGKYMEEDEGYDMDI